MKLYFNILVLFLTFIFFAPVSFADFYQKPITMPIDARHSSQRHNNIGTQYFKEGDYFAAIKEYRIAIGINPNSQASAVFYNNLGKAYLALGEIQVKNNLITKEGQSFSKMAEKSFEQAILRDCMKIEYYQNLVNSYELLGSLQERKNFFLNNRAKNPFNIIPAAIILQKIGNIEYANMLIDDFVSENPNLIISKDLKKLIIQP